MVWIELEGAVNVRDVGGLPTVDGGETVYRRVLRSENLQELTAEDIVRLVDEIGVTTIVDLRSTRELMTEGPAPLDSVDGVQHAHHPVLKEFLDASDCSSRLSRRTVTGTPPTRCAGTTSATWRTGRRR
jgi:protein-tyrosine phosphatase